MADKPESKPNKDLTPGQVRQKKAYWIGFAIALGVSAVLAVGSFFLIRDGMGLDYQTNKWRIWADTFTLPGVLYLLSFLLVKVSDFGAFDAIAYSVRLVITVTFRRNVRDSKLPPTYHEYRLMRMNKPRTSASFLLIIGLFYLLVTAVFLILYYVAK